MKNTPSQLHNTFEVELLKRYLDANPQESRRLAIAHFEDYLELVHEYKKLEQKQKSPSLPPIINKIHSRLRREHENLQKQYLKVVKENACLKKENQDLMQLINNLTDKKSPLPDFIRRIFN